MTSGWQGATHYRNIFRKVDRKTWDVGDEIGIITGGSLEFSALSDLKVSGSLEFKGFEVPDSRDLIIVYHSYDNGDGEKIERPLATLVFSVADPTYRGMVVSGTMECQSVLAMLSSRKYGAPFTIAAGTQAIQLAIQLIEECGLRVNNPDPSAYTIKSDVTISQSEASYLNIVNRLLSLANYSSAWVDAKGIVQITSYDEPIKKPVSLVLSDEGDRKIMYPEIVRRNEWASTPNVVKVYYETESESLMATATNVDPDSPESLPYRGFEVTDDSTKVTELEGDTQSDRLKKLEDIAEQALLDKTTNVEYVEGACEYVDGLAPNNAIAIEYMRAGMKWRGSIMSVRLELAKTLKATFSARRFIRSDLDIEKSSEKIWG